MSAPTKLAGFGAALAILFAGSTLAGAAIDPDRGQDARKEQSHMSSTSQSAAAEGHGAAAQGHGETKTGHGEAKTGHGGAHPVRGLAVAENGLRLEIDDPEIARGRAETLRFRIVDDRGETVRDFDVEHERRMHLIVARRDLTGFQHLHPTQGEDGGWSTRLRLDDAGSYRVFADFSHGDEPATLAADLRVDGPADLRPLPAAEPAAVSDGGYDVRLDAGRARPGRETDLRFTITRGGETIHTEPYLGAGGHLVALREGDLAFLHVHPTEHGHDEAAGGHDDAVGFAATFPTEGRYRLFLQFKHEGRVQTVAFTQEVR